MTTPQLIVMTVVYSVVTAAVVYFTRPTGRRFAGALAGGTVVGVLGMGVITLGNHADWWRVPLDPSPGFLALFYLGMLVSCTPIYLVTWRVARRFGQRGLAVFVALATVIGPPRDYSFAARYPEWITFGPGIAPVVAVALTYAAVIVVGHGVMRGIAGPASEDRLARQPRRPAESSTTEGTERPNPVRGENGGIS
jgi:hypothetical protein